MLYSSNYKNYPDWLIDATPGARRAYEAWTAVIDGSAPLRLALRAAQSARRGKVAHKGEPGAAVLAPATGVSTAEFDELMAAVREAENALSRHDRNARDTRARFDAIMTSDALDTTRRRTLAAEVALARHAEAEAAWATFVVALDARDAAYFVAGLPGRPWTDQTNATGDWRSMMGHAQRFFDASLSGFDVRSVEAVALGEVAA